MRRACGRRSSDLPGVRTDREPRRSDRGRRATRQPPGLDVPSYRGQQGRIGRAYRQERANIRAHPSRPVVGPPARDDTTRSGPIPRSFGAGGCSSPDRPTIRGRQRAHRAARDGLLRTPVGVFTPVGVRFAATHTGRPPPAWQKTCARSVAAVQAGRLQRADGCRPAAPRRAQTSGTHCRPHRIRAERRRPVVRLPLRRTVARDAPGTAGDRRPSPPLPTSTRRG